MLRRNKDFKWNEECVAAFNQLKEYLSTPLILAKPEKGETLYLYVAVSTSAVNGVLVREDQGEQNLIFYVSKTVNGAETRYTTMEKLAFAVSCHPGSYVRTSNLTLLMSSPTSPYELYCIARTGLDD